MLLWLCAASGLAQIPRSGYLKEGFEGGTFPPAGWQQLNVTGAQTWVRSTAQTKTGSASAFIRYQNAGAGEDWLVLPRFRVAASDSLTFWLRLAFKGYSPDELNIRLSTTDSATASFTTELLRLQEGVNYPGNATSWSRYAISLSAYAGQKVYVAFRHTNNDGDGLYLDDVTLGTKPDADVVVSSLVLPGGLVVGRSYVPQATITNIGGQAQSFPVALTIGAYASTRTVTALAPNASTTLSFDAWTPTATGPVTATVVAQLAGDATPGDNQLSRTAAVYGSVATASGAKWRAGVNLPAGRWAHGLAGSDKPAMFSPDPTVLYAVSGGNSSFANEASVVRYEPATSSWTTRAAIPLARTQVAANWLGGKLYVAGGYSGSFSPTNRLDIYNPATDTWAQGANLPTAVGDYASVVYQDSLLYLIGGYNGGSDVTTVQVYNPRTNTWATGTPFGGTAAAGLRAGVVDNKLVVVGGYSQSASSSLSQAWLGTIDAATPTTISWTALPAYPGGTIGRLAVGALTSGQVARVFFAGGDPSGSGAQTSTSTWAYDLASSQWLVGPDLLEGVSNVLQLAPLVQQDSVYLVCAGGYTGAAVSTTTQRLNLGHRNDVLGGGDLVVSSTRTVPGGAYRNVTVTSTGDATVTAPLNAYGAVRVESGGKLRLNAPLTGTGTFELQDDATLAVQDAAGLANGAVGAIRLSGNRSLATGATYVYAGTTAQQTGAALPATVRNLTIANPAGVALSQATAVERVVRCESGTLATDAASGHTLTLLSNATTTATALVAALGGRVGGDGGVLQRALDPGNNTAGQGYRHYASPVAALTVAALAQPGFAPVVNPAYNTAAQPGLTVPFPTLFTYDETRVGPADPSFEAGYRSPAASSTLPAGQGFSLNVPNWLRVDFKGSFNTGTLSLTGLSRGSGSNSGWQLLGNPYPAPLDWSLVTAADRPGLEAALYVVQSTGAYSGQYRAYVNGVPAGNSPLIPAGQGFFVRTATAGSAGSLTFRDAQRVTTWGAQPAFQRTATARPVARLTLRAAGSTTPLDEAHVYCEAGATAAFDREFDAWKLPKAGPTLALVAPGAAELLSISGLPALLPGGPEQVVPLSVNATSAGALSLTADLSDFPAGTAVLLRDRVRGVLQNLSTAPVYALSTAPVPGQLELVLRPATVTGTATAQAAPRLQAWPNPARGNCRLSGPAGAEVAVLDALGRCVRTQRLSAAGLASLELGGLGAGVYVLRAGEQALRLVIE
ncbi:choice-of-anchor J domain-containing protein [Hymenobacter sp. 15J16-1T3B]|uniref:choice-of-anchor J domain-containing protein n=1 Tax=Hymenobacter sp. 15J16-1T3B TaxID=2886941 RepID=UPI001D12C70F|nr:choice-of-anchor J domain-containing protein [Hymenobacter sp. 15J16-1T3B]MCC3158738.1 choice-of-anchor J domain-containing protein [Hymenobacter sp. 15J16-1T3B]